MKNRFLLLTIIILSLASCGSSADPSVTNSNTSVIDSSSTSEPFSTSTSDPKSTSTSDPKSTSTIDPKSTSTIDPYSTSTIDPYSTSSTTTLLDFENAVFESKTFPYDGKYHTLDEVSGIPNGTTVTYTNNEPKIDAGTYNVSAKLEKEGYNTKTLHATLTISKIDFSVLSYDNKTVIYDGKDHINDIQLIGF